MSDPRSQPRSQLEDAGYVALGLGVMTFQRAQVARRALERRLADSGPELARLLATAGEVRSLLEERAAGLAEQLLRRVGG